MLGYVGQRPGEALMLSWDWLLDDAGRAAGPSATFKDTLRPKGREEGTVLPGTKTYEDRTVRLEPVVRQELNAWWLYLGRPARSTPVFPAEEGSAKFWTHGAWSSWGPNIWKPALKAVGLDYVVPYHLRHSAISMWIREGAQVTDVADRAGHSVSECLKTYAKAFKSLDPTERFVLDEAIRAARSSEQSPNIRTGNDV